MSSAVSAAVRSGMSAVPTSIGGAFVYFPNMSLTLVRRVSARLPYNHFLFRCDPKYTKHDIKEYLTKVYNVDVARVTTAISLGELVVCETINTHLLHFPYPPLNTHTHFFPSLPPSSGKTRRAAGRRSLHFKLKDYKRALVVLRDDATKVAATPASAVSVSTSSSTKIRDGRDKELR